MKLSTSLLALATTLLTSGSAAAAQGQDGGWRKHVPGGETSCSAGGEYSFYVRPADPKKVLLFLAGGGACWDGKTCVSEPTFRPAIPAGFDPSRLGGILDLTDSDNPFRDFTTVYAPYCTGDLHLGRRDQRYSVPVPNGTTRDVEIRHRGQTNALAVLDWIAANHRAPTRIVVVGGSAGSVPTPFYGSLLAQRYPETQVAAIGDGAGAQRFGGAAPDVRAWGHPEALRRHRGWEGTSERWTVPELAIVAAQATPRLGIYQVDQAWDQSQAGWTIRLGGSGTDVPAMIRENTAQIRERVPAFRAFLLGGMFHTILEEPGFYSHGADGVWLRDWIAAIAAGDTVRAVECRSCWRPELRFRPADLAFLDSVTATLSRPGGWKTPDDAACSAQVTSMSFRCALFRADQANPQAAAANHEVNYTALDGLGLLATPPDPRRPVFAPRVLNDRPGATVQDLLALLRQVRARVLADLDRAR